MRDNVSRSAPGEGPAWTLADRLRKAREHAGLEQRDLVELAGISRATISNAERGLGTPNLVTLQAWAQATGVSLAWLVADDDARALALPRRVEQARRSA